jgi:predicted RNase H-like nuclease (RuvC/YqgF family)
MTLEEENATLLRQLDNECNRLTESNAALRSEVEALQRLLAVADALMTGDEKRWRDSLRLEVEAKDRRIEALSQEMEEQRVRLVGDIAAFRTKWSEERDGLVVALAEVTSFALAAPTNEAACRARDAVCERGRALAAGAGT